MGVRWPMGLSTLHLKDCRWAALFTVDLPGQEVCIGNIFWGQPETWTHISWCKLGDQSWVAQGTMGVSGLRCQGGG